MNPGFYDVIIEKNDSLSSTLRKEDPGSFTDVSVDFLDLGVRPKTS